MRQVSRARKPQRKKLSDYPVFEVSNIYTGDQYLTSNALDKKDIGGVSFVRVARNVEEFNKRQFKLVRADALKKKA